MSILNTNNNGKLAKEAGEKSEKQKQREKIEASCAFCRNCSNECSQLISAHFCDIKCNALYNQLAFNVRYVRVVVYIGFENATVTQPQAFRRANGKPSKNQIAASC